MTAAREERCPECGGGGRQVVVDRDVLDRACERAHALEHIEAKERRAIADAAPVIVKAERERIARAVEALAAEWEEAKARNKWTPQENQLIYEFIGDLTKRPGVSLLALLDDKEADRG